MSLIDQFHSSAVIDSQHMVHASVTTLGLLAQASLNQLEAEASGFHSSRSVCSSRALEGAVRLRDLASPVRPRSVHSPRAPSPSPGRRGGVPEEVVRRLEDHDDQQVHTSAYM